MERFEEHWRGQAPFKNLIIRVIPETSTQVAELKTGGVDIIRNLAPDLIPDLKAHANTYVSTAPILRTHYVELDMREPPFNKKEARQAANYAIDRQAIVEKLMGGWGRSSRRISIPWRLAMTRKWKATVTIRRRPKS